MKIRKLDPLDWIVIVLALFCFWMAAQKLASAQAAWVNDAVTRSDPNDHVIVLPNTADCKDERIGDDSYVVCRWHDDAPDTDGWPPQ